MAKIGRNQSGFEITCDTHRQPIVMGKATTGRLLCLVLADEAQCAGVVASDPKIKQQKLPQKYWANKSAPRMASDINKKLRSGDDKTMYVDSVLGADSPTYTLKPERIEVQVDPEVWRLKDFHDLAEIRKKLHRA